MTKPCLLDQLGNTHLSVLIVVSALIAAIITSQITTTTTYPNRPSQVLGDESTSGSSGSGKSSPSPSSSPKIEDDDIPLPNITPKSEGILAPIPQPTTKPNEEEMENERETQSKKGTTKVEFKAVDKSGKTHLEAEKEGNQILTKEERDEVEDELEKEDIHFATTEGKLVITKKGVGAVTKFPVSVDPTSHTLTITSSSGVKTVTILPDQAVSTILSTKALDRVLSTKLTIKEASESAKPNQVIELIEKNNQLVYQIKGSKNHKLLGFIPISTNLTIFISANSGNLVSKEQSLLARIIELLSFSD